MIDSLTEDLVSLSDAAKLIPARRAGKKPHVSCLYRWAQKGCKGIILESVQVGGTRCTSREAMGRFFTRLSEQAGIANTEVTARTSTQRERDILRAEKELNEAGY